MGCALQQLYHGLIKRCAAFNNNNNNNNNQSQLYYCY